MSTPKKLDSIISIDNESYSVIAEEAKVAEKVANSLTINAIKNGETIATTTFDGSNSQEIDINVDDLTRSEEADKIQVNLDNGDKPYATITVSTSEPTGGNTGDIWFKY